MPWKAPRGLTLTELLVSLLVTSIVIAGAIQMLLAFRKTAGESNARRDSASRGRAALTFIEKRLKLAGYGLEPALAFDFNVFREHDQRCTNVGQLAGNDCPARRDSTTGPDELVFYARDPAYFGSAIDVAANEPEGRAWKIVASTATTVELRVTVAPPAPSPPNGVLRKGQILQLLCPQASASTYVEVADNTPLTVPSTVVPLLAAEPGNPYRQAANPAPCIVSGGEARAFMVNRFRFHVADRLLADGVTQVPFLMLDHGIDRNLDGDIDQLDEVAVAANVVDFQVAYGRPDASLFLEVGATPAVPLAFCDYSPPRVPGICLDGLRVLNFVNFGASNYGKTGFTYLAQDSAPDVLASPDAANISRVHLSLVTQSETPSEGVFALPATLNRDPADTSITTLRNRLFKTSEFVVPTENAQAYVLSFL